MNQRGMAKVDATTTNVERYVFVSKIQPNYVTAYARLAAPFANAPLSLSGDCIADGRARRQLCDR
jgi:hypothetical protein